MTMITPMHLSWWWRLQFLQWMQSGRVRPLHRAMTMLTWWLPCVIAPVVLILAGAAAAGLDFLLSLDVPLTLVVAVMTAVEALGIDSRASSEDWLWPPAFRPARLRWVSLLRWLQVARWPAGLALAAVLLALGAGARPELLTELLLMVLIGLLGGSSFAWAMRSRSPASAPRAIRARHAQGLAALSWVALHETRDRLDPGRVTVLAVPILLLAPVGAMASHAMKLLALWLPMLFLATVFNEARRTQGVMRSWLNTARAPLPLTWWIWRHVAMGIAAAAALLLLWAGAAPHMSGRPE